MGSYIRVQRICELCGNEFTAQTTVTKYCSAVCSKRAYKAKKRAEKISASNSELNEKKIKSGRASEIKIEEREFLSVPQVALLIGCSRQNVYYLINTGQLKASNIMQRKTIIKRSDLDIMLSTFNSEQPKGYNIKECYTIGEAQMKFKIPSQTLYDIIKRNNIPKIKNGKFVYVPKELVEKIFS